MLPIREEPHFGYADSAATLPLFMEARRAADPPLERETCQTYLRKLDYFRTWWRDHAADQPLTERLATRYVTDLMHDTVPFPEGPPRPRWNALSIGLHLSALRQWSALLVAHGYLDTNPFTPILAPRRPRRIRLPLLSRQELEHFLNTFNHQDPIQFRDYVLALVMLRSGARESELTRANIGDLVDRGDDGSELLLASKGKHKEESVVLRPNVRAPLLRYLQTRYPSGDFPPTAPLFANGSVRPVETRMTPRGIRKQLKNAFARADLRYPRLNGLSLRLSGGAQAHLRGADTVKIKRTLRHESIRTTQVLTSHVDRIRFGAEAYLDHFV